jgi:hypothetical protein
LAAAAAAAPVVKPLRSLRLRFLLLFLFAVCATESLGFSAVGFLFVNSLNRRFVKSLKDVGRFH